MMFRRMRRNEHSHISRARRDFRGRNMVARSLAEKMKNAKLTRQAAASGILRRAPKADIRQ